MNKNTMKAIQNKLNNGETQFFVGEYFYEFSVNGIRRREQSKNRLAVSDWEIVEYR